MEDTAKVDIAVAWLKLSDALDYDATYDTSAGLFRKAVSLDDWRKALRAARAPLGSLSSRTMRSMEELDGIAGAPDGQYTKILFDSAFENRRDAQEMLTLVVDEDDQPRTAGYFVK